VGIGIDSTLGYRAPPFDYDGDPRPNPVDNLVDMGAQESNHPNGIIKEDTDLLPMTFSLKQNYPNPFNPKTVISYQLPVISEDELSIYNLLGQKMATLVSEKQPAGTYKIEWDASDFASGIYYYRIEAGRFVETKKLVLLK